MWRFSDSRQLGGIALVLVCVLLVLAAFMPMPTSDVIETQSSKDDGFLSAPKAEMNRAQSDNIAPSNTNAAAVIPRDDPFALAIQRARADSANTASPSAEVQSSDLLTAIAESKKRTAPISTASPFGGTGR